MDVTSNNSNMKTEVELYLDQELSDITFDADALDEWKSITTELGFEKQMNLAKGVESPVPFPYMNESMNRVYSTLCPTKVKVSEYDKTPIPLEVIKQISFCIKENHFSEIEIWYDDKQPDPLVVGKRGYFYVYDRSYNHVKTPDGNDLEFETEKEAKEYKTKNSLYSTGYHESGKYLVARWGDVKRSFNELKQLAKERFVEKHAAQMKSDIESLTGKLNRIEENATLYLLGEITESKATSTQDW